MRVADILVMWPLLFVQPLILYHNETLYMKLINIEVSFSRCLKILTEGLAPDKQFTFITFGSGELKISVRSSNEPRHVISNNVAFWQG